ncbi:MAG: hypothetical protein IPJ26_02355 [Bacteroidetes bacterium]|nr:hypothetical protein [Bacteroidota bacterium]
MKNLLFVILIISFSACSKDDDPTPVTEKNLEFELSFVSGSSPLQFDTIMYTNAAGNVYSVSRLQFYISNIQLIKSDSSLVTISDYNYVDARVPSTLTQKHSLSESGHFIGMKLQLGLDTAHNKSNFLPAIAENINMVWPDMMGGGYHFMKFEGYYVDGLSFPGFAMHLGRNAYVANCVISHSFDLVNGNNKMKLVMDLNEWFANPHIYDFNIDGNSSMGDMNDLLKLSQNGTDIFTLQ